MNFIKLQWHKAIYVLSNIQFKLLLAWFNQNNVYRRSQGPTPACIKLIQYLPSQSTNSHTKAPDCQNPLIRHPFITFPTLNTFLDFVYLWTNVAVTGFQKSQNLFFLELHCNFKGCWPLKTTYIKIYIIEILYNKARMLPVPVLIT